VSPDATAPAPGLYNRILQRLPPEEYLRIARSLELRELRETSAPDIDRQAGGVDFPLSGAVGLQFGAEGQGLMPVAVIGHEGLLGLSVLAGAAGEPEAIHEMTLAPGYALSSRVAELQARLGEAPSLRDEVGRFTTALVSVVASACVCPRVHGPAARLARWLLAIEDRAAPADGVSASTLSAFLDLDVPLLLHAAAPLIQSGALRRDGERLHVTDHDALRGMACECYERCRGLML
jgi:hypothetical protein